MYKNTYDREAFLYVEERRREEARRQQIREATAGKPPVYAPLLTALGHLFTRIGARLQADEKETSQPVTDRGEALLTS